jgi:transposase
MMKRRELKLKGDERGWLEHFTGAGSANYQAFKRAQILLAADGPNRMGDAEIARTVGVSKATVYNVRRRYLSQGIEGTVKRKARKDKGVPEKVDGRVEAHLIALACSATPNEEPVWTLKMLADKLVELELVDSISREKVRQVLKKTSSSRS